MAKPAVATQHAVARPAVATPHTQIMEREPERAAVALGWLDVGFNTPDSQLAYLGRRRAGPGLPFSDLAFSDPRWRARFEPKPTGVLYSRDNPNKVDRCPHPANDCGLHRKFVEPKGPPCWVGTH